MHNKIKTTLLLLILISFITGTLLFNDKITNFIIDNYIYTRNIDNITYNMYSKRLDYNYYQTNDSFVTKSKRDLINNIYTIVDSGINEFSFYCDKEYTDCEKDVMNLLNDGSLTSINNFVHPFNSYNKLYISTNSIGKVTVTVDKLYSEEEINYTINSIKNIVSQIGNNNMTTYDRIKAFHDYVIENTRYDREKSEEIKNHIYGNNKFNSHKASGVLTNHIALCSGYTDLMAVYLNMIGVKNFKVSTNEHIWNAVYLDNNIYHLDLTWDDPDLDNGMSMIIYSFFLITDEELTLKETQQHTYNKEIYKELATNN